MSTDNTSSSKTKNETKIDLHRSVRPGDSLNFRNAISKARIVPTGNNPIKRTFDVHYWDGYIVKPPGKDSNKYGGLSVCSDHENSFLEDPPQWNNLENEIIKYTKNLDEIKTPRFFCYKLVKGTSIPHQYSIKEKEPPQIGYNLHPNQEIKLEDIKDHKGIPWSGKFPKVADLKWEKCCVILKPKNRETYEWMKGKGPEPSLKKHQDPECEVVLSALNDAISFYDYDELDEVFEIIEWIERQETFDSLRKLSKEKTRLISIAMEELMCNCHPDDADDFYLVRQKFSKIEDEIANDMQLESAQ